MSFAAASRVRNLFFAALRLSPLFLLQIQFHLAQANDSLNSYPIPSVIYESGVVGPYPVFEFPSAPALIAPRVNFLQRSPKCLATERGDDANYLFVAPRGGVAPSRPIILDERGQTVWSGSEENGNPYDFKVQRWKGEPVLTYWTGDDEIRGHGSGEYHILNQAYEIIRRVSPGYDLEGDLHEFIITDKNTAIMTIYQRLDADLSPVGGPADGRIWDSLFQELDLDTNQVLFQWRASDYLEFGDTYRSLNGDGTGDDHWDWFHLNSIDKDDLGNYLISARYTHSLMYIDGGDGHIIWTLGGKRNDFEDLSEGRALNFAGQHDARWHENQAVITLFDNGADYDTHMAKWSRGLRLGVNIANRTVELLQEFIDPGKTLTVSQGSMQVLSNGNVLLGYGFNAYVTEFDSEGNALCDMHLSPKAFYDSGDVQTYRAAKHAWQGFPSYPPSIAVGSRDVFLSWNGATEVHEWVLKAGDDDHMELSEYRHVASIPKHGFETQIALYNGQISEKFIYAVALDADGAILAETDTVEFDSEDIVVAWQDNVGSLLVPAGLVGVSLATLIIMKRRRSQCYHHDDYTLLPQ